MDIDISKLPPWTKIEITKADLMAFAERLVNVNDSQNSSENDDESFLTIEEAARFLKLAKQSVYGMTSRREIKFFKKGKRLYFKKCDLIAHIESGKQKTSEESTDEVIDYLRKKHKS